uniref:CSON006396 protein n=1 Tax=Culicoides sonorensis TaxID=179676 RepID=A0A336MS74_CULSO
MNIQRGKKGKRTLMIKMANENVPSIFHVYAQFSTNGKDKHGNGACLIKPSFNLLKHGWQNFKASQISEPVKFQGWENFKASQISEPVKFQGWQNFKASQISEPVKFQGWQNFKASQISEPVKFQSWQNFKATQISKPVKFQGWENFKANHIGQFSRKMSSAGTKKSTSNNRRKYAKD